MPTTVESTISLSGTPDYSTLQAWEDASPVNLITDDKIWRGVIQESTDHFTGATTQLSVAGSTTDATRYKELTVKDGASFADNSSNELVFDASNGAAMSSTSSRPLVVDEANARISRVQIALTSGSNNTILVNGSATGAPLFENLIIQNHSGSSALLLWGANEEWRNCVMIQVPGGADRIIRHGNGNTRTYKNCTFVVPSDNTANTNLLLQSVSGIVNFVNCASFNNTNLTSGTGTFNYTTCISDVSSPPAGVTTSTYANADFTSSLAASMDFRHSATSTLTDVGTDDADTATDIFGTTRPSGSYDVGVYEFSAGTVSIFDNDGAKAFWLAAGFTGSYNDMQMAYLKNNLSKTGGSNSDLLAAYLKANGEFLI